MKLNSIQKISIQWSNDIAQKTEDLLQGIIPEGFTDADTYNRCRWQKYHSDPNKSVLYIDDEPVLLLWEPEYDTKVNENGGVTLVCEQKFLKLS
jgi:hypothetical protein